MNRYLRSAVSGVATGGRTFTGLAALTLATPSPSSKQPDAVLAKPWVKALVVAIAAQELVADKLPNTPSRLKAAPITVRGLTGAGTGIIIARREGAGPTDRTTEIVCSLIGAAAALTGSWLGARWRKWAAPRLGGDLVAALIEDASVIAISYGAASA